MVLVKDSNECSTGPRLASFSRNLFSSALYSVNSGRKKTAQCAVLIISQGAGAINAPGIGVCLEHHPTRRDRPEHLSSR